MVVMVTRYIWGGVDGVETCVGAFTNSWTTELDNISLEPRIITIINTYYDNTALNSYCISA